MFKRERRKINRPIRCVETDDPTTHTINNHDKIIRRSKERVYKGQKSPKQEN